MTKTGADSVITEVDVLVAVFSYKNSSFHSIGQQSDRSVSAYLAGRIHHPCQPFILFVNNCAEALPRISSDAYLRFSPHPCFPNKLYALVDAIKVRLGPTEYNLLESFRVSE